jgi:hypothetical protein
LREQGTHLGKAANSPYVLHPDDYFTTLVVRNCQKVNLKHSGGIRCLPCELNRSCWVTGSINSLTKLLKECTLCRKMRPRPIITRMALLPDHRVPCEEGTPPSPYENVTLEAAGPWRTGQGRGKTQTKHWFLIFQCILYGLVHIDMLYYMDSASFLTAFDRFCSDHRVPSRVKCENVTNFVCCKKDLNDMWSYVSQSYMEKHKLMITWDFSPPFSPHQNGLAERMVGSAKTALKTILDVNNDS